MKIQNWTINNPFSVTSVLENNQLIKQDVDKLSTHQTDDKYLVLSNELGYFNKLTQFIVGNVSSLLFLDKNGVQCTPTIRNVQKNTKKYFLMYPLPVYNIDNNDEIEITIENNMFNKNRSKEIIVKLDFNTGFSLGQKFAEYKGYNPNIELTDIEKALNGSRADTYFWPDKNIIINSNKEFAIGILVGYFSYFLEYFVQEKDSFFIHENDNIYIFATLLNYLGANYNIHNIKKKEQGPISIDKVINIKLPNIYEETIKKHLVNEYAELLPIFMNIIKRTEWYQNDKNQIRKFQTSGFKNNDSILNDNILNKGMIIVPMTAFKFIKINSNDEIYDLTTDRADATNFALPFTPILKNSDGDILTLSTAFSKEAIEDAKAFEPSSKEWFRNLNDGKINTYIKDDALLGLYALTKYV